MRGGVLVKKKEGRKTERARARESERRGRARGLAASDDDALFRSLFFPQRKRRPRSKKKRFLFSVPFPPRKKQVFLLESAFSFHAMSPHGGGAPTPWAQEKVRLTLRAGGGEARDEAMTTTPHFFLFWFLHGKQASVVAAVVVAFSDTPLGPLPVAFTPVRLRSPRMNSFLQSDYRSFQLSTRCGLCRARCFRSNSRRCSPLLAHRTRTSPTTS